MNPCLFTKLGIEYQQAYDGPYEDLTLRCGDTTFWLARKGKMLSGFGRPAICVGDAYRVMKDFTRLYYDCPRVWYMDMLEGGAISEVTKFLLKQGREPHVIYTQVIDLTQSETALHAGLSKSCQNLANKYRVVHMPIYDQYGASSLWSLHYKVVGKATRNRDTWGLQEEMVEAGQAFCLGGPPEATDTIPAYASAALFLHDKDWCYYGVAATLRDQLPDGNHIPSHPVIWAGILEAKRRGCKWLEMGLQSFGGDEKTVGISRFKRAFGGTTQVRLEFQ